MDVPAISATVPDAAATPARPREDPAKIAEVTTQFESLLLTQMLKSMREAGSGGWMGSGEDQAGASMLELAEEQFARVMSAGGGLGLAAMARDALTNRTGG